MNILLLTTIYPEPVSYGIENDTRAVHYFAREWVKMGHRVVVLHLHTNAFKNASRMIDPRHWNVHSNDNEGVKVFCTTTQILKPHSFVPYKWQQEYNAIIMVKALTNEIKDFIPDAITVHFPMSLLYFYNKVQESFPTIPSYAVIHGSDIRELQKRRQDLSILVSSFRRLLFRSPKLKETAVAMGVNESICHLALSGIDTSMLLSHEDFEKKVSKTEKKEWKIIYVGKLNAQKCVETVIDTVDLLKLEYNLHLDIVGDGPNCDALKQKVENLSLEDTITFWGKQPRNVSVKLMKDADVFVMVSRNETFGLVYLEAMSQGCIAIGSKGEGIDGFIIDGENGFLVEAANAEALAIKLRYIFNLDAEEMKNIITKSYHKATMMTGFKAAQQYLGIIKG